jgi:D-psicose/D-tagatose/L-ribulose 3-epimerase
VFHDFEQEGGFKCVADCVAVLCRYAEPHGSSLLAEQMNRYETNYLSGAAEVVEYGRSRGITNLKIQTYTFHMDIQDRDFSAAVREYAAEIGYIHFADSNSLAPASGRTLESAKLYEERRTGSGNQQTVGKSFADEQER